MSAASLIQPATLPGIFLGGLRGDLPPGKLAGLIADLLGNFQAVPKENVDVRIKSDDYAYAIVDLEDQTKTDQLLAALSNLENVQNLFDLSLITNNLENFRVALKKSRSNSRHRGKRSKARKNKTDAASMGSAGEGSSRHASQHASGSRNASGSRAGSRHNSASRPHAFSEYHAACIPDMSWAKLHSGRHRARSKKRRRKKKDNIEPQEEEALKLKAGDDLDYEDAATSVSGEGFRDAELSGSESSSEIAFPTDPLDVLDMIVKHIPEEQRVRTKGFWESRVDSIKGRLPQLPAEVKSKSPELPKSNSEPVVYSKTKPQGSETKSEQVSTTTSTNKMEFLSHFLVFGEEIGRESRHVEFKQGANRQHLQDKVGKYVCGFLNSGEGGTLFFGVKDDGLVTGIECPREKEDDFRLLIDDAMKRLRPPVFPDLYSVKFIPVMMENGQLSDSRQVLAIEVKPVQYLQQLYVYKGDAYIRRDGSLQGPLKAEHVQEWIKQQQALAPNPNVLSAQLEEMTKQLEQERERNANIHQKLAVLEHTVGQVQKSHGRGSKVCSVM